MHTNWIEKHTGILVTIQSSVNTVRDLFEQRQTLVLIIEKLRRAEEIQTPTTEELRDLEKEMTVSLETLTEQTKKLIEQHMSFSKMLLWHN